MKWEYIREEVRIYNFIKENKDKIIVFGYGGCNIANEKGYYCFGLVYKMNLRIIKGRDLKGRSANRNILTGIKDSVKIINKPSEIIILTSASLGFKKCELGKGPNQDICNDIIQMAEQEKECKLSVLCIENSAEEMRFLLDNADKYFRVLF